MGVFSKRQCEICKTFSNVNRVVILMSLKESPRTVSEIVSLTNLSQSVVSQHLSILKKQNMVISEKNGAWVTYVLKHIEILDALATLKNITEKISGDKK